MIIFPAIDIKEGKVVRLAQGKFDQVTEYAHDPVEIALKWQAMGANWIHVIDLDGAKTGESQNLDIILKIVKSISIPIQVGGGIRDRNTITKMIDGGVSRIILGTIAIESLSFLKDVINKYQDKIAVSLDCQNGMITTQGWASTTQLKAVKFAKVLEQLGLSCLIYTDIARDGMLTGPNYEVLNELLEATSIPVIASGGVSTIEDITKLKEFEEKGLLGAISGKALYEGKIDLEEAIKIALNKNDKLC